MTARSLLETSNAALEVEAGVGRLVLQRPEIRNALAPELERDLIEGLKRASEDEEIRALMICGASVAFSAGGYIRAFDEQRRATPGETHDSVGLTEKLLRAVLGFSKPAIAVVEGYALGGGLALALCCDLVWCADDAKLGFPEVSRGFVPAMAVGVACNRLPSLLAREMLLSAQLYPASTLAARGASITVFTASEISERAAAMARTLADMPPAALRTTKRLINLMTWREREADLELLSYPSTLMRYTDEFARGVNAFNS